MGLTPCNLIHCEIKTSVGSGSPSYLEHNAFVDGELCDDVGEQQVAVVLGGGVHAVLTEQAGPCERHQAPQLVTLFSGVKYRKCI